MKQRLKGFTLIELIIVMALFSLVMYSVIQLLDPVTKFFVRSSNFESTTACVDNITRSIEGNLKYADRVRAYAYYSPYSSGLSYTDAPDISSDLSTHVTDFYNYFFQNRRAIDSAGYIYVLAFDNTRLSDADIATATYNKLSDFSDAKQNSGKMILYKFWFNNYDDKHDEITEILATPTEYKNNGSLNTGTALWMPTGVTPEAGITDWYVNQKLYGNYEYRYELGTLSSDSAVATPVLDAEGNPVLDAEGNPVTQVIFNPADFTIEIKMTELRRNGDGEGLVRVASSESSISTFSMKNVLDSSASYSRTALDYLLTATDETVAGFTYSSTAKNRYAPMTLNPLAAFDAVESQWTPFDGFYFIFTLPETTYTNGTYYANQS